MSYDVSVGDESFNYTSNVSQLFYDHIPALEEGGRGGIPELHGKTGKQAAAILKDAFFRIERTRLDLSRNQVIGEPFFCSRYDSSNAWGSTVGGLLFLAQILGACAANPRSKVRVHY